jgi:hypothetical protein
MSTVTRREFIQELTDGQLDLHEPSTGLLATLQELGVDPQLLREVAGANGRIDTRDEARALYDLVEDLDHNGTFRSLETETRAPGGRTTLAASGQLYQALKTEIDAQRTAVHLGQAKAPRTEGTGGTAGLAPTAKGQKPEDVTTDAQLAEAMRKLAEQGLHDIHLTRHAVYYGQADDRWADHPYPKVPSEPEGRTLKAAGCAPTALAIIDATLRGTKTTPTEVADFAVGRGHSGRPGVLGTLTGPLVKDWARDAGLDCTQAQSLDDVREGLRRGGMVLLGVGHGHFTLGKHVMVINGYAVDEKGNEWFFVANPGKKEKHGSLDGQVVVDPSLGYGAGCVRMSRKALQEELQHAYVLEQHQKGAVA